MSNTSLSISSFKSLSSEDNDIEKNGYEVIEETIEDNFPEIEYFEEDQKTIPLNLEKIDSEIANILKEATKSTGTSVEMCFMSFLNVLNVAVVAQANVDTRLYKTPINLFLLNIAESGERKTTVNDLFIIPISNWKKELEKKYKSQVRQHIKDFAIWEEKNRLLKYNREKRGGMSEADEELFKELISSEPKTPQLSKIAVDDFNIPSLKNFINKNPLAITNILTDEGGKILSGDFFKKFGVEFMTLLNNMYDNKSMSSTRVGSGDVTIENKRLSVLIQIQPKFFQNSYKNNEMMKEIGFVGRFLTCISPKMAGTNERQIPINFKRNDSFYMNIFYKRIEKLISKKINYFKDENEDGTFEVLNEIDCPFLTFSDEAFEIWRQFLNHLEERLGRGGEYKPIKEYIGKSGSRCARIAANFHLFFELDEHTQISAKTMSEAIEVEKWGIQQHLSLHQNETSQISYHAMILLNDLKINFRENLYTYFKIMPHHYRKFTKRKNADLRDANTRTIALNKLIENKYILCTDQTNVYKFNPKLFI